MKRYRFCADHDPDNTRRRRFGEAIARDILKTAFPESEGWTVLWNNRSGFAGDASNKTPCMEEGTLNSKRFEGDFYVKNETKHPGRVVYIEHDENQHKDYQKSCEAARTCAILQWRSCELPMLVLRVNPDEYTVIGEKMSGWQTKSSQTGEFVRDKSVMERRYEGVVRDAKAYFEMPFEDLRSGPQIMYNLYFFDNHTDRSTVQKFAFNGPILDEFGIVNCLDLTPL
jgi:hypothetical protein